MLSIDTVIAAADGALRTLTGSQHPGRPYPAAAHDASRLSESERSLSGALMRVNHVGEVCAQALYSAQALTSRTEAVRQQFEHAAHEEIDHLAWTDQRLRELGSRPSLLNPVWFAGAFTLGLIAGKASETLSLGFVAETEHQVARHLESHLSRLPAGDAASRDIVRQMRDDEMRHASAAEQAGGTRLPRLVRGAMRLAAKVMTTTAHYV